MRLKDKANRAEELAKQLKADADVANASALSNREKAARYDTVYDEITKLTDDLAIAQGRELERARRIRAANAGELIVEFPLISGEVSVHRQIEKAHDGLVKVRRRPQDLDMAVAEFDQPVRAEREVLLFAPCSLLGKEQCDFPSRFEGASPV